MHAKNGISDRQYLYCLHVDAKSNSSFYNVIKSIEKCFQNVYVLTQRIRIVWSQYTLSQPVLECIKYLLKFTHWYYSIILIGQELPLKTKRELAQILKAYNNGKGRALTGRGGTLTAKERTETGKGRTLTSKTGPDR